MLLLGIWVFLFIFAVVLYPPCSAQKEVELYEQHAIERKKMSENRKKKKKKKITMWSS